MSAAMSDYGDQQAAMQVYLADGEKRAFALGNRGPMRFSADGRVHPDILAAYWRCGFYVFEGVLAADELVDIEADFRDILDRLPSERRSPHDRQGRPALGADCKAPTLQWSRPLGDPVGGTQLANGRHPLKMFEPQAAAGAPKEIVYLILGSLQFSPAALRVYGHPHLLAMAAAVNGDDFVPFNEAFFHQRARPRRLGRLASGRHHPLEQRRLGRGHARLQFHGPALRLHAGQRGVGGTGFAQTRQGRHQGDGGCSGLRAIARRGAHRLQAGRRGDHQPAGGAWVFRQHQPRLARDAELRLSPSALGAGG